MTPGLAEATKPPFAYYGGKQLLAQRLIALMPEHRHGTNRSMPYYLAAYCERIAPCSTRLAGVSLDSRPAVEVIEHYGRHDTALLYVDPPYFVKRSVGYVVEMKKPEQHGELLAALRGCRAKVLLSNYANDLYDTTLADWNRVEIKTWTGQGGSREDRTEVVWMNYEPPTRDHGLFGEAS